MQTILTSDTINQGRVKVNDNTAKSVTGATTGTQSGQIDFKTHDPAYNFTTSVNLPNVYEGGIIDGMAVTQDGANPLKWNIAAGTYVIGGNVYSYAGGSVTLSNGPLAATSAGRADLIIATSAGVTTIAGSANSTTPITPFFQESSQLPLAVIVVTASASSTSPPYLVNRVNVNFSGRIINTGSTVNHAVMGVNGPISKFAINMGNGGYINSDMSYIFGGRINIISGTTNVPASLVLPNDVIIGGLQNNIGSETYRCGIFGNTLNLIKYSRGSNILGSDSSTISGNSLSLNNVIVGGTVHQIRHNSEYISIFGGQSSNIFLSEVCSFLGGVGTTVDQSFFSTYIGGYTNNLTSTILSQFIGTEGLTGTNIDNSVILGGGNITTSGITSVVLLGGSGNTVYGGSSRMLNSTILNSFDSRMIGTGVTTNYAMMMGGYGNSLQGDGNVMLGCKNSNISTNRNAVFIGLEGYTDSTSFPTGSTIVGDVVVTKGEHLSNVIVATSGTTTGTTRAGVYLLNSAAGPITFYLPASSTVSNGYTFTAKDYAGSASTYNITVQGNGTLIDNISAQTMSTGYQAMRFHYSTTTGRWHII